MTIHYLDLADYLLIAEGVLGIEAEVIAKAANLHLADSALNAPMAAFADVEFHETFQMKAAVLCTRIAKNHALPDGNKRVAYECLREFVARNGYEWSSPPGDEQGGDETVDVISRVAASAITEEALAVWIRDRITGAQA